MSRTGKERVAAVEVKRPRGIGEDAVTITDGVGPIPDGALELFARWLARGRAKRGASDA